MQIVYSAQASKFLAKITAKDAKRIVEKIEQYSVYPAELKNQIKKLKGTNAYRLRVGDYRVIFDENGIILNIIKIGNRGDVYEGI